ncbi:unnamed protein product [Cylindrotheca closterium]|uniref:Uncharacterized protein n=1 Tax=Cylindrotheca closterium TaxID=2856 RepID=A0AAD2FRY8_9STRA|nr:unnamed protein product [Cylindrotheca closterium]
MMQIPTQGGGTVTVPYSMNANGEFVFSGMQLSRQGCSGAQVCQGFDAAQARTPQAVKTGYFDTSNVFHNAMKGKDETDNDVYRIPCPAGTTDVKLQADWHYAKEDEDLPDLATKADRDLQFIQSRRKQRDPFGLYDHVIMDSGCTNTTICNGELMHGLHHAEKELDMHTNVGSRVLDEKGFLGRFPPPVYHDEDGIANVLAAGYRITMDTDADNAFTVHCDGNRKMQFVNYDMLDDMGVTIDPTAAGDHEPTAERNNRTLKERVRVALARLLYKVVPKVITECLGRRAAKLLNVFPQKDSISSHFSPQQLIDNVNINYKSDMVAELGQHVHAIGTDSNN